MKQIFDQIITTPLPAVRNSDMRKLSRKEWAVAVRKLLKDLGLKGISVTTPSYSMAQTIHVTLPDLGIGNDDEAHNRLHDELWKAQRPTVDCPHCAQRWNARNRIEAIILAAFPDLENRSNTQYDHFDYCLSIQ